MKYLLPSGLAVAAIALSFASCIRDEALNAECDITGVDSAWVAGIRQQGIIKGEPIVTNESVRFIKRRGDVDCSALAPLFTLTPGATIEPATQEALRACARGLSDIAQERIGQELDGILATGKKVRE